MKIELSTSDEESKVLLSRMDISSKLLEFITKEIKDWLFARDMEIVKDDPDEEMVSVAGGTLKGHGNIEISFYFKNIHQTEN